MGTESPRKTDSTASFQGPPSNWEEADKPPDVRLVLWASKGCQDRHLGNSRGQGSLLGGSDVYQLTDGQGKSILGEVGWAHYESQAWGGVSMAIWRVRG